jgi:hypothetical protein
VFVEVGGAKNRYASVSTKGDFFEVLGEAGFTTSKKGQRSLTIYLDVSSTTLAARVPNSWQSKPFKVKAGSIVKVRDKQ